MQRQAAVPAADGLQSQISQLAATLGTAFQQLLALEAEVQRQNGTQQGLPQLEQPSGHLLLGQFHPRSISGPWPVAAPPQAQQFVSTAGSMPPAAAAAPPPSPADASADTDNGTPPESLMDTMPRTTQMPEAVTRDDSTAAAGQQDLHQEQEHDSPAQGASLQQQTQHMQQQRAIQDEQEQEQEQPLAPAPAGAEAGQQLSSAVPPASPVASEPISSSSSSELSGSPDHAGDAGLSAADGDEPASPPAAAVEWPGVESLRRGEPEVVSGHHAACCTLVRLPQPGEHLDGQQRPCCLLSRV